MADLSNISALSGLTITSDQNSGTSNPYATFAVSSVTDAQKALLQNVTPYVVNGATVKIKEGTIIFNISVDKLQMFRNGQWENITTNITPATGDGLNSAPFAIPSGPKVDVEVTDNQYNGFLYYDTTYGEVKGYIDGKWMTLFTVNTNATGTGLRDGAPLVLPLATATTDVEVTDNEDNGFLYYNELLHQVRARINGQWMTLFSFNEQILGTGLTSRVPLVIPSGPNASVQNTSNQRNGFLYYDTTYGEVKGYIDDKWMTLFTVNTNATGVGLTNGAPLIIPSGPSTSVEVNDNEVTGFVYYNTTANNLRIYDHNSWVTIPGT